MPKTPKEVKKLVEDAGVKIVDLRFVDLPGVWQHFSLPAKELSRRPVTRGASGSTGRASGASSRSRRATCS